MSTGAPMGLDALRRRLVPWHGDGPSPRGEIGTITWHATGAIDVHRYRHGRGRRVAGRPAAARLPDRRGDPRLVSRCGTVLVRAVVADPGSDATQPRVARGA